MGHKPEKFVISIYCLKKAVIFELIMIDSKIFGQISQSSKLIIHDLVK